MKSIKLLCAIVCGVLMSASLVATAAAEPTAEAKKRLASCDHYMSAYARSSARKLSRALSGQKFEHTKLPPQSTFAAGDRQFELLFENDGASAGVVEKTRTHRATYVLTHYQLGPVVAVHQWPSRDEIAGGKECKPVSSHIAFPEVPVAAVDVEPFKFWGLRIVWHVPTNLPAKVATTSPLDALRAAIESSD